MAEIRRYPFLRHIRGEPTFQTLVYRNGALVRSGRGLAMWFRPLKTGLAEVPMDDREVSYLFRVRTADFQEATVQGAITYRVQEAETLAEHIDFTLDLDSGLWARTPLEQLAGLLTQLGQQHTVDYLAGVPLELALVDGVTEIRTRMTAGLESERAVAELGIEIVAVRVAAVRPTAELERALQTPAFESIHQQADEATFHRRAMAVEKERAIAENELQNQIELTHREEELIARRGEIERRREQELSLARRIEGEGKAAVVTIAAEAEAGRVRQVQGAEVEMERLRMEALRDLPAGVLAALALRELASKSERIDHLNLTPDLLTPLLGNLVAGTGRRLGA